MAFQNKPPVSRITMPVLAPAFMVDKCDSYHGKSIACRLVLRRDAVPEDMYAANVTNT